jgi:hypothetical protein
MVRTVWIQHTGGTAYVQRHPDAAEGLYRLVDAAYEKHSIAMLPEGRAGMACPAGHVPDFWAGGSSRTRPPRRHR